MLKIVLKLQKGFQKNAWVNFPSDGIFRDHRHIPYFSRLFYGTFLNWHVSYSSSPTVGTVCGLTFISIKISLINFKISNFNFWWFSLDFSYVYLNSKLILYNHWESRLNPNWPKNSNQLLGRRNGLQRFNHFLHCFLIMIFLLNKTRLSTLERFQQKFQ